MPNIFDKQSKALLVINNNSTIILVYYTMNENKDKNQERAHTQLIQLISYKSQSQMQLINTFPKIHKNKFQPTRLPRQVSMKFTRCASYTASSV